MNAPQAVLRLADDDTRRDLATYVVRARRADPDGDVRLTGHGTVLAVYVSPVHGPGLPVTLGLRTLALAAPWTGDVVTPLAGVGDRLAHDPNGTDLPLPPVASTGTAWAGISPPRSGWRPVGQASAADVERSAQDGIAEIAVGAPEGSGSLAVSGLRAQVWSRPASWSLDWPQQVPAAAAYAAHALGFLPPAGTDGTATVAVFAAGSWTRVTAPGGHVLLRTPLLG